MKTLASTVLFAFCFCLTVFAPIRTALAADGPSVRSVLKEPEPITALTDQIKANPKNAMLYAQRGQCYVDLRDWKKALADTNKAIELEPTRGNFYTVRGAIYQQIGEINLERRDLELGARISPNEVPCLKRLAAFNGETGKFKESYTLFTKAISIKPQSADLYLLRAETLVDLGELQKAKDDCDYAEKLGESGQNLKLVRSEISKHERPSVIQK